MSLPTRAALQAIIDAFEAFRVTLEPPMEGHRDLMSIDDIVPSVAAALSEYLGILQAVDADFSTAINALTEILARPDYPALPPPSADPAVAAEIAQQIASMDAAAAFYPLAPTATVVTSTLDLIPKQGV